MHLPPRATTALTLALAALAVLASGAAASPYAKGPAPTAAVLAQTQGPYDVGRETVPDAATTKFGPATIWLPQGQAGETFGGVAISPGFLADGRTLTWLAKRLASQGFVAIVISTNSIFDRPASRGGQLLAALDYLTTRSANRGLVDPTRLAVVGHSMGGGGVLEAAKRDLTLKAVVSIFPWDLKTGFGAVASPTLVIGSKPDWIAPVAIHALPIYASLAPALPKAYLELTTDHAAPIFPVTEISRATTSWLKRFLDDDERYTQALCPAIGGVRERTVTAYRGSCGAGPLA